VRSSDRDEPRDGPLVGEALPLADVEPQHPVREPARRAALVKSIRLHGWRGRPIVVADFGRGLTAAGFRYLALTGTHRLAALRMLGSSDVPSVVVDVSGWPYADARALDYAEGPEDKAGILGAYGHRELAEWVFDEGWPEYDRGRPRRRRASRERRTNRAP